MGLAGHPTSILAPPPFRTREYLYLQPPYLSTFQLQAPYVHRPYSSSPPSFSPTHITFQASLQKPWRARACQKSHEKLRTGTQGTVCSSCYSTLLLASFFFIMCRSRTPTPRPSSRKGPRKLSLNTVRRYRRVIPAICILVSPFPFPPSLF